MLTAISGALLAGLFGSPHCVGMCGPFALACGERSDHTVAWHAGKLSSYSLLGAAAGFFGAQLPGPTWLVTLLSSVLVVWFAASLAGVAPEPRAVIPGLEASASKLAARTDLVGRFLFGSANGLLPCGLVYAALGLAVATGSLITGAAMMVAFGLGTTPALVAFTFAGRRLVSERPWARRALAGLVLLSGLWVVWQRATIDGPFLPRT